MSAKVLVPLATGFEEIEAVTIIDVLRRAKVEVQVLAIEPGAAWVEGSHGISIEVDGDLSAAPSRLESLLDAIVLPGGMPGSKHLSESTALHQILREHHSSGTLIAAICAAPIALEAAGLLKGRNATSYPSFQAQLQSAKLVVTDQAVVEDSRIMTSQGPGTALEFSLALVARLCGAEAAQKLREGMLVGRF